jgi:hypothetical protein
MARRDENAGKLSENVGELSENSLTSHYIFTLCPHWKLSTLCWRWIKCRIIVDLNSSQHAQVAIFL